MSTDLREELHALAHAHTFSPDPHAWDRGRRARRRTRVAAGLAAVAVVAVAAGAGALAVRPAPVGPASDVAPAGAIPSRVIDPGDLEPETDLAVGRASVAFFSAAGQPVVVTATDGRYHALDLPDLSPDRGPLALSPDGRDVAWRSHGRIHTADLEDGTATYYPANEEHADVTALQWVPGSRQLLWNGTDAHGRKSGGVLPVNGGRGVLFPSALRGIPSPAGDLVAVASDGTVDAAPFLRSRGRSVDRALSPDIYPNGAQVTPLGWATDDLLLAQVHSGPGSYVEGQHLALFTAPNKPESEWTYRIVARDIPQDALPLSVAVDLVPDLDGTSSQELTHDFEADDSPPAPLGIELSLFIGLGVAAAIAVLMALRWLWRRLS